MITFQTGHPDDPIPPFTQPIWRHMGYMEFMSLLTRSALHFARVSKLPDLFEGALTPSSNVPDEQLAEIQKRLRQTTFVNCWYEGEAESAAMWDRKPDAVAIKTNMNGLSKGIRVASGTHIYVGRVRYSDYDKAAVPLDNEFSHFLFKRSNYSHEQEIRAMARATKRAGQKASDRPLGLAPTDAIGVYVDVDLGVLIDEVVASPTTPGYVFEALESVANACGLTCPFSRSSLSDHPPLG